MYTINDLRKLLGLSTANQVRNRIEAVKDLIAAELRRGPNNQILVTDAGLSVLRRLQELYDSGLTITQASDVLRASGDINAIKPNQGSPGLTQNRAEQNVNEALIAALRDEIAFLRERVAYLEARLAQEREERRVGREWWEELKEETDGA